MTDDAALIARLRNTPNWLRQDFGPWKDATNHYDRAPFEAADRIAALTAELTRAGELLREEALNRAALSARATKAEAERDALREDLAMAKTKADEFDRMNELRQKAMAERDALREDAERYRWLRRKQYAVAAGALLGRPPDDNPVIFYSDECLDSAIDAARREPKP